VRSIRLTRGQEFTAEQQRWLERIRYHLIANLSIDKEDFENVPVLQGRRRLGELRTVRSKGDSRHSSRLQ